jgi:protein-S-isoprenylcysteine O-methyltransferase Ste14
VPATLGPALKTLLFTILVPGSVTILVPHLILPPASRVSRDAWGYLGLAALVGGAAIYLRSAWMFAYRGVGTPAPVDPPKVLVDCGLNRFVRNPMYIGVLAIVLGEAAIFGSRQLLIYSASLALCFHLFVVFYEEPALKRQFGKTYDEYQRTVPRWIPRFR